MSEDALTSALVSRAIASAGDNPYLTYHTLVLRLLRDAAERLHVPWSVVEESMAAPYRLDADSHALLSDIWKSRTKVPTIDETHCVERVLGRDRVKASDLAKLAACLKGEDACRFFAVDGFAGPEPRQYVEGFRYGRESPRGRHVRAVRDLYAESDRVGVERTIAEIFAGGPNPHADEYARKVGGPSEVAEVFRWREEIRDKQRGSKRAKRDE